MTAPANNDVAQVREAFERHIVLGRIPTLTEVREIGEALDRAEATVTRLRAALEVYAADGHRGRRARQALGYSAQDAEQANRPKGLT